MSQISEERLKRFKKAEFAINKNLFIICAVITFIVIAVVLIEFFGRGAFPPSGINFFYIGVLFLYSIHKEILRWLEKKEIERQGEWFVYVWIALVVILYIINFLAKGYFSCSSDGVFVGSLGKITAIALEVFAIFILTRLSKAVKMGLEKK